MRVAIFVAVVAVHIALLWLLPSWRRAVLLPTEGEASVTSVFLPLLPQREQRDVPREMMPGAHGKPIPRKDSGAQNNAEHQESPAQQPSAESGEVVPSPPALIGRAPDWRADASVAAQNNAQRIVAAEEDAAGKADALASHFKPLPDPRVPAPEFGWDRVHTHRITPLQGGGFVVALSERCSMLVFIVPMMIGCAVGRGPPARGDLFTNMRPPVKFGDWDWRVTDP